MRRARGMFFVKTLKQSVELPPRFLGQNLIVHLHSELIKKVEGTCAGSLGYIVCVTEVKESGRVSLHTIRWRRMSARIRRRSGARGVPLRRRGGGASRRPRGTAREHDRRAI